MIEITGSDLAEKIEVAKETISQAIQKFNDETGFVITDIDFKYLDAMSKCGTYALVQSVSLKITTP